MDAWRHRARGLVYPGLDLHTRNRAALRRFWKSGPRDVLDAGSGNGYFAWLAYRSGARVVAMNVEREQVERARGFILGYLKADPAGLCFEERNLYTLVNETRAFDEIICFEVLEHLQRDEDVVREFHRILRPGGRLHLCCPYRDHPRHQSEALDREERGGHVRAGYTEQSYRALLEPAGFHVETLVGIGPSALCHADTVLRAIRRHIGDLAALPLLPFALPFVWGAQFDPPVPFSLYVRAAKA